jgi:hypothetical protein
LSTVQPPLSKRDNESPEAEAGGRGIRAPARASRPAMGGRFLVAVPARLLFVAVLVLGCEAMAQEALRSSLAGQSAMDAKKRQISQGWGDVHLGPVNLDLGAQLSIEASDNVRYSEQDPQADLIFSPGVSVRALWPVSEKNRLSFGAGVGYRKYLQNADLDYLYITPDSDVGFDLFVGDFIINFHDRFHFTSDVASQPGLSGRGSYGQFDNSLGVLTTWDLNKAVVSLNYDHLLFLSTETELSYLDRTSELFGLRSAWLVTPVTPLGIELSFGTTDYDKPVLDDLIQYSAGAFYEVPAGKFSSLRLAGGYVIYEPTTHTHTNSPGGTMDAIYADLSWNHRITEHISYSISAGQQLQAGYYSETMKLLYARTTITWNILRGYGLSSSFAYENGEQGWLTTTEHFVRYSAGLSISKRLSQKLSTAAGYSLLHRTSDIPGNNYSENRLALSVSYSF